MEQHTVIPATVSERAQKAAANRPDDQAAPFFSFQDTDEVTGQTYCFAVDTIENAPFIASVPKSFYRMQGGGKPVESWHGEEIGRVLLADLPFIVFKLWKREF